MSYQDRIDIDRLYDLIYDAQSEQLKVVTREEFEQLFGSISSFKDMQDLYYDKSEVYLKIVEVLKEAGVITEDTYNELIAKIQTAQNTANLADTKATNAVGTANNAHTSATNALNGVNRIDGEIGDTSTQGTIKYDVNRAKTQSSQAIQDSSVAKQDSSQALTNSNDALEGVDDIRDEIGNATTPNTIKYDVFNAKSNSTEALSKSNQAISDSSDALDLAETVDGKADDLRRDVGTVTGDDLQTQVTTANGTASNAYTLADGADTKADNLRIDVGTVNQPTDGSLQQQITYLPSYLSKLVVSADRENWQNIAHLNLYGTGWIRVYPSELAYKQMRDDSYIEYTIEITEPDNTVYTYTDRITSHIYVTRAYHFNKNGIYIIACDNLKCVVAVGDYTKEHTHTKSEISDFTHTHTKSQITDFSHTHTKSEITNFSHSHSISDITNLQSSLDAKQDSISWETKSVGVGTLEVCSALRLAHWSGGGFYNVTQNYKTMTGVDLSDYAPNKPITTFADSIIPLLIIYIQTDGVVKYASQSSTGNFYLSWDILWKY